MKRLLRILLLDYLIPRRRRQPRAEAVATRGRWTFLADCGQNRVTVVIRDTEGKLIHQEQFAASEFDGLLSVGRSILLLADSGPPPEPTSEGGPVGRPNRPRSFPRLLND